MGGSNKGDGMILRNVSKIMIAAAFAGSSAVFAVDQTVVVPVQGDACMVFNRASAGGVGLMQAATTALGAEEYLSVQYCQS